MKTLLHLVIATPRSPHDTAGKNRFVEIAAEEGLKIEPVWINSEIGAPVDRQALLQQIQNAHGYWITETHLLDDPEIREIVESRLREGAIAIAELRGRFSQDNSFYEDLGIEGLSIRANRTALPLHPDYSDERIIFASRSTCPLGFRDHSLFSGVDELVLQQVNGIGCLHGASAVLAIPSSEIRLTDMRSDLFVTGIPRPELSVIATSSKRDWRGRVIAINGGVFDDAYEGITGIIFPGISAGDNDRFTQNCMRLVASGTAPAGRTWEDVYRLLGNIEMRLAQITRKVLLQKAGENWLLKLAPEKTKEKCFERLRSERHGFPIEAYLDLLDIQTIWKFCWAEFFPLLEAVSPPASKGKSLRFFSETNEIRKLSAHPAKRILAGIDTPSPTQFALLQSIDEFTLKLTDHRLDPDGSLT